MKSKIIILFISICVFLLMTGCQGEKSDKGEWQGTVEEKDGVRIVHNPEAPFYGELELDLGQDLSIGNEDDEPYFFYRAFRLGVDSEGNMYVMDAGNSRIQKFDPKGEYVQTIGKKGQGPGEFDSMYGFYIDQESQIYVSSGTKIQKFSADGAFEKGIALVNRIFNFWVSPEDIIYGIMTTSREDGRIRQIVKVDMQGNELEEIAHYAEVNAVNRKGERGERLAFVLVHNYNHHVYVSPFKYTNLLYGYSADYRLSRLNAQDKPDLIIHKEEPYHSISSREKDEIVEGIRNHMAQRNQIWPEDVIMEACQFPDHRPFFSGIISDDQGRIYVHKGKSVLNEDEIQTFDIFSADGIYLYRTELDFVPQAVKNGFLYRIESDENTGSLKVIRYRINNWDEIRASMS
ncbi:MAG: 6-bladed beta-propeller [Acidobacteriota bacterium]